MSEARVWRQQQKAWSQWAVRLVGIGSDNQQREMIEALIAKPAAPAALTPEAEALIRRVCNPNALTMRRDKGNLLAMLDAGTIYGEAPEAIEEGAPALVEARIISYAAPIAHVSIGRSSVTQRVHHRYLHEAPDPPEMREAPEPDRCHDRNGPDDAPWCEREPGHSGDHEAQIAPGEWVSWPQEPLTVEKFNELVEEGQKASAAIYRQMDPTKDQRPLRCQCKCDECGAESRRAIPDHPHGASGCEGEWREVAPRPPPSAPVVIPQRHGLKYHDLACLDQEDATECICTSPAPVAADEPDFIPGADIDVALRMHEVPAAADEPVKPPRAELRWEWYQDLGGTENLCCGYIAGWARNGTWVVCNPDEAGSVYANGGERTQDEAKAAVLEAARRCGRYGIIELGEPWNVPDPEPIADRWRLNEVTTDATWAERLKEMNARPIRRLTRLGCKCGHEWDWEVGTDPVCPMCRPTDPIPAAIREHVAAALASEREAWRGEMALLAKASAESIDDIEANAKKNHNALHAAVANEVDRLEREATHFEGIVDRALDDIARSASRLSGLRPWRRKWLRRKEVG